MAAAGMAFLLLLMTIFSLSSAEDQFTIEGDFVTKGGSVCKYKEQSDKVKATAAISIECECKTKEDQQFKYSCLYEGEPEECPESEKNEITFYDQVAEVFESKQP